MDYLGMIPESSIFRAAAEDSVQKIYMLPEYCQQSVLRWIFMGAPAGSFLTAVFRNDLLDAATRADGVNLLALKAYACFLHDYAPGDCHGSVLEVNAWQRAGGLVGLARKEKKE